MEEIAKAQIEALDKVKLFANILEENGVKVLNIHTSEQKDGNVEKINCFIKGLQQAV